MLTQIDIHVDAMNVGWELEREVTVIKDSQNVLLLLSYPES